MGPVCNFCGKRCFTGFPNHTPEHIRQAYGGSMLLATCEGGQAYEKGKFGYCYNDIVAEIKLEERIVGLLMS